MRIVHVACINLNTQTGMGRIAVNWKMAFESAGHQFVHIGVNEVEAGHVIFWGKNAVKYCKLNNISADIWLVHEPFAGFFRIMPGRLVVFSHGIEERAWLVQEDYGFQKRTFKSFFLPKKVRFLSNNRGLRDADLVLLSNNSDKIFLEQKGFTQSRKFIFKNGYSPFQSTKNIDGSNHTILFNGTWIERKGVNIIYKVFNKLLSVHSAIRLILAGTAFDENFVITGFHRDIRGQISIIPSFTEEEEAGLYSQSSIFILPSYFEGQSLALTQAMAMGLCPVVSDNSGQIDFVKHQGDGLVFETGNAESLYKQLIFLIENDHLIQQYGNKARQSVADLEWDKVAEEVVRTVVSIY